MAKERTDLVGQRIGLFDSDSDNSLFIEKAADITEECPNRKDGPQKVLLLFTTSAKGIVVQLRDCCDSEGYGTQTHYHVHLLDNLQSSVVATFRHFAEDRFGLTTEALRELVRQHTPNGEPATV